MKICIDARAAKWYRGTGIGTYTYQLIKNLNNIDKINDYLLFMPDSNPLDFNFSKNFKLSGTTKSKESNFWEAVNFPKILTDKDIEIYHVPQNGVGLCTNKKCPFVITLHDVIPYKMPETTSKRLIKIFNEDLPQIVKLCDGIITVSNYSKIDIAKAFDYPLSKIYVTYLASEDIYCPKNKCMSKKIIKKAYGIDNDFILYVGGFSPRKNIIGLIKAFEKLIHTVNTNLTLVIAGNKGVSYDNYISLVEKLGLVNKVIFPGFIDMLHMPYLYSSAELFVYPSYYEGFGLPPIEAMACGIPVITSNLTSLPEITAGSALLVNPYDIDSLCDAIISVIFDNDKKNGLAKKGLMLAQKLKWKNTALETLSVYKKILQ
jgi:glycosyltransferase involved in cell wall biosynthesis